MSAESCLRWPEFYMTGQKKELFNPLNVGVTMLYSIYTSTVTFFFSLIAFQNIDLDYQTMAVTVETSVVFSVIAEVLF